MDEPIQNGKWTLTERGAVIVLEDNGHYRTRINMSEEDAVDLYTILEMWVADKMEAETEEANNEMVNKIVKNTGDMSILAVITEDMPYSASLCRFANCSWNALERTFSVCCPFFRQPMETLGTKLYSERCPDCPLTTTHQYEERNALIPAESRSMARRVNLMKGEK